jgi:hypothetical protein
MKRKVTVTFLITLMILILVGCGAAPTPEPTPTPPPTPHPGKSIVTSRCLGCHSLTQLENSSFNERGWQLVVERMQLLGVQLTDDQVVTVVDYLSQSYPYSEE